MAERGEEAARDRGRLLRARGWPRSVRAPLAVLTGALLVQLVLHGWTFAAEAFFADRVLPQAGGGRTPVGHLYLASFWVFALAIPVGCVAWMRWLDWSVKNVLASNGTRFGRTPAQVVWAYFVPGVNLYEPLRDLRRLYRANARGADAPGLLTAWWAVTLAHLLLMLFDLREGITVLTAASSFLGVLSQALALVVLRLFAARQETSAEGTRRDAPRRPAARPDRSDAAEAVAVARAPETDYLSAAEANPRLGLPGAPD